jgi:hypothetical protein
MWIEVKKLEPTSTSWFTTNGELKGHEVVSTDKEIAFPFHSSDFTVFLFMRTLTAGGHKWVRVLKSDVVPASPSDNF